MTLLTPELLPTKTYPFSTLRYKDQQTGLQEGVIGAGDFQVTQRAAGANMTVDVAAGGAWVQGDDATRQGLYHLVNDAVLNVGPFPAAHATLPTVHQVIQRVYDSSVVGTSDIPMPEIVPGTPTSGAQIATPGAAGYRAGAGALPNGAIRIADVIVPAAATQIVTANIVDRRPWARGLRWTDQLGSGNTTSVTSPGTQIAFNAKALLECSGVPVVARITTVLRIDTSGRDVGVSLLVDGVVARQYTVTAALANPNLPYILEHDFTPTPGLHAFDWYFYVGGGAAVATMMAVSQILIKESLTQTAKNG